MAKTMLRLQRGRPVMYMNTGDAGGRGIADGDLVEVRNDIDRFRVHAKLSPSLRPGQLIIYHAWENYQFPGGKGFQNLIPSPINPIDLVRRTRAGVVRVGLGEQNDWRATGIRPDKNGVTFRVAAPKMAWKGEYRIHLLGRHQVTNALLAMAVSEELGLDRSAVRDGLAGCQPARMRLQYWEAGGVRVLDDTYNANADSALVALETLCDLPLQGRRVAVLGDMNELGAQSEAAHAEVGRRAAELGIGQLFAVGKMAPITARAAHDAGLNRMIEFADVETAMAAVRSFLKTGDVVLLKASRAVRLERIAETLRAAKS